MNVVGNSTNTTHPKYYLLYVPSKEQMHFKTHVENVPPIRISREKENKLTVQPRETKTKRTTTSDR